jgi:D-lyxose ketol-isomerase
MDSEVREKMRLRAVEYFNRAHIYLTDVEKRNLEIADMGLGRIEEIGIQIHVYIDTKRCSAKEMVLFPNQICPEQRHPPFEDYPGKEESFRVRYGTLYLYVEGDPVAPEKIKAHIPQDKKDTFTVFHEIILHRGDQYTLGPNITHWICGGPEGCVVSEFATYNRDDLDVFTDPAVKRLEGVQ